MKKPTATRWNPSSFQVVLQLSPENYGMSSPAETTITLIRTSVCSSRSTHIPEILSHGSHSTRLVCGPNYTFGLLKLIGSGLPRPNSFLAAIQGAAGNGLFNHEGRKGPCLPSKAVYHVETALEWVELFPHFCYSMCTEYGEIASP